MSLGKQAKTLSKGQVEAVLGYLAKTRRGPKPGHLPLVGQGGPEGQGDSPPDLVDDERLSGGDRPDDLPPGLGEQGEVGPDDPDQRGAEGGPGRVPHDGPPRRSPRDRHREGAGHLAPGDRQPVPPLVPAPRLRGMLQPQREADLHHQRGAEDLDGRGFPQGRPGAGRAQQPSDHAAVHRREPGGSRQDRRARLARGPSLLSRANRTCFERTVIADFECYFGCR